MLKEIHRNVIENWRGDYNHHRPHGTLGYVWFGPELMGRRGFMR